MKTIANEYADVIAQSAADFFTPAREFANPHYYSSDNAGAYVVTAWALYTGILRRDRLHEFRLKRSRGYSWKVEHSLGTAVVRVTNDRDHRNGVEYV